MARAIRGCRSRSPSVSSRRRSVPAHRSGRWWRPTRGTCSRARTAEAHSQHSSHSSSIRRSRATRTRMPPMVRLSSVLVFVAACGFHRLEGSGDVDAPPMFDDAGREIVNWTLDESRDFTRPGSQLVDMSVEPWGSLSPGDYFYGVSLGRAASSAVYSPSANESTLVWAPGNIAGTGGWDAADFVPGPPPAQFGITGNDFTIWLEGEMFLAAGTSQLRLSADDIAFLELAPPHTIAFERVAV